MYGNERFDKILDLLKVDKKITVNKIVKTLYISPATARRDLESMEKRGLIKRIHGGAILSSSSSEEDSLILREEIMKKEKIEIAKKCVDFIKSNRTLFIDSSSTAGYLVPLLNQFQYLTLITNGLSIAQSIKNYTNFRAFVPGGFVQNNSNSIVGDITIRNLSGLHCDILLFSCAGIDFENGLTEASIEQSEIKKLMMKNSILKILLVDSSKFGKTFFSKTADINEVDILITDKNVSLDIVEKLKSLNIKVIY